MTDTKPDIPQEMVEKAEIVLVGRRLSSAPSKDLALACLEAAGVGELIAERNHARREYALHKSLASGQVDSLIEELAEVKAARPSRETVDKLLQALLKIQGLGCMNTPSEPIWCNKDRHSIYCPAGMAHAALSAYESEIKR